MLSVAIDMNLPSAGHTELLGAGLARSYPRATHPGMVLYLRGDLGAGKTTCVRGLLQTLGVTRSVRSPTYTLVQTYALEELTCVHVDLYRLSGEADAEGLGLRDMAAPGCLLLVEWPEKGGVSVPRPDVELRLEYAGGGRIAWLANFTANGQRWLQILGDDASLTPYVTHIT